MQRRPNVPLIHLRKGKKYENRYIYGVDHHNCKGMMCYQTEKGKWVST